MLNAHSAPAASHFTANATGMRARQSDRDQDSSIDDLHRIGGNFEH